MLHSLGPHAFAAMLHCLHEVLDVLALSDNLIFIYYDLPAGCTTGNIQVGGKQHVRTTGVDSVIGILHDYQLQSKHDD